MENSAALQHVAIHDLRAELMWKTDSPAFTLALEDDDGPWWSVELARNDSGSSITVNGATFQIPAQISDAYEFHLFLDASVAELIVNRRHAITTRIYRQPNGPLRVKSGNGLASLRAWQLRPISPNRLTT
jgi:hypothetical protein